VLVELATILALHQARSYSGFRTHHVVMQRWP
jgi:hypothetical protein